MLFRYSRWDGSQQLADLDADDLLSAMSDDLMSDGDLWNALRRMFQRGVQMPHGPQMPGLQNLMDRLRKRRQEQLDRYDLGSALEDIKKKLDEVIRTERAGIERQVPNTNERAKKMEPLDQLPPDAAGRIKQLQSYNFTDPEAERLFQELMQSLQQQMMQPFMLSPPYFARAAPPRVTSGAYIARLGRTLQAPRSRKSSKRKSVKSRCSATRMKPRMTRTARRPGRPSASSLASATNNPPGCSLF